MFSVYLIMYDSVLKQFIVSICWGGECVFLCREQVWVQYPESSSFPLYKFCSSLDVFAKQLRRVVVSVIMSISVYAWKCAVPAGQIFLKFYLWQFC